MLGNVLWPDGRGLVGSLLLVSSFFQFLAFRLMRSDGADRGDSVRENYMLHIPVRMSISSIVRSPISTSSLHSLTYRQQILAKILRTTDAKALEAHNTIDSNSDDGHVRKGTKEKKTSGAQGRSQVMNLLTIDTNTVASLATHTWGFTNGITTCTYDALYLSGPVHPSLPVLFSSSFLHLSIYAAYPSISIPIEELTVQC